VREALSAWKLEAYATTTNILGENVDHIRVENNSEKMKCDDAVKTDVDKIASTRRTATDSASR
jgi:hypothetical protein